MAISAGPRQGDTRLRDVRLQALKLPYPPPTSPRLAHKPLPKPTRNVPPTQKCHQNDTLGTQSESNEPHFGPNGAQSDPNESHFGPSDAQKEVHKSKIGPKRIKGGGRGLRT